jgi:hypothetical protein
MVADLDSTGHRFAHLIRDRRQRRPTAVVHRRQGKIMFAGPDKPGEHPESTNCAG